VAHFSGNPTWQDYPAATTPISAARLEALERVSDGMNPLVQAGLRAGKLRMSKVEAVGVAPGQVYTLLNVNGPGVVQSVWMALGGGNGPCLDGRLRVFYDGSSSPAVDIDLGTLLMSHYRANGPNHSIVHVHVEINSASSDTGFLITFPMPFGTSMRVDYLNPAGTQTALIYSMITYRLTSTDDSAGLRLRCSGARYAGQAITRTSNAANTLLSTSGGPGWIIYQAYLGGVGATNLSWLERNIQITTDAEAIPQITASGTEDWFDSAWYYQGVKDYNAGFHSFIGTDQPPAPNQYIVGMATDFLSKWGGVPFDSSATLAILPEPACTTGDTFCYAILYYQ
jgi:hypothetical protein